MSDDGDVSADDRLMLVPARTWPVGAMRPVFSYFAGNSSAKGDIWPRYVGTARGPGYMQDAQPDLLGHWNATDFRPIGFIPQVSRTFKYFDADWGVMNEHGLAIGESTCAAKTHANARGMHGGRALFTTTSLSRVALERCKTARCAVELMGNLAEAHGFYGTQLAGEGSGEALHVIDRDEAWTFHIISDDTGTSAIWAAQRLRDDHATVVANHFTIRGVNLTDSSRFLGSPKMESFARRMGWHTLDPLTGLFDFTRSFGSGEYSHKYYSGRRTWRVLSLLAPSLGLAAEYGKDVVGAPAGWALRDIAPYPFSVRPDARVTAAFLRRIHRDSYEGTPFDMSVGLAAGPFGSPNRWAAGAGEADLLRGAWERPIALYRSQYSYVAEVISDRRVRPEIAGQLWFGPNGARSTVFVPIFAGITFIPPPLTRQNPFKVDRASASWSVRFVGNVMDLKFSSMVRDVDDAALVQENASQQEIAKIVARERSAPENATDLVKGTTAMCFRRSREALSTWWELVDRLIFKYGSGYLNEPSLATPVGYPKWWLRRVGYLDGPERIPDFPMCDVAVCIANKEQSTTSG
jgi:dipeptidase